MKSLNQTIEIPEGIDITTEGLLMKIKGPNGEVERIINLKGIEIKKEENIIKIDTKKTSRNYKKIINTTRAHIINMIKGVQEAYVYKLKVCSGHFPMTVTIENKEVIVKNFLGEKKPRKAKVIDGVEIKIDKDEITIESPDIEKAGQTAANIETSTRITKKDRRVFMDGIWITQKANKEIK
jgi:large subunit ribosomal protein L6